jgi:uncharacterized MnhB-related membrane protein
MLEWIALLIVVIVLASALAVLTFPNMIGAVTATSVVSLGVSVLFVLLHAPDAAMTEAAVGAGLSGVVLALGLRKLGLWRLDGDPGRAHALVPTTQPTTSDRDSPNREKMTDA